MNTHNFIFSNRPSWRLKRHIAFWLFWWVYWMVTIRFPNYVFPNWDIQAAKLAYPARFQGSNMWEVIVQAIKPALRVFPLHLVFTYSLIYFLLPRFFFKKKNLFITAGLFFLIVSVILLSNYYTMHKTFSEAYIKGLRDNMPGMSQIISRLFFHFLSIYPVVAGFAITIKLLKRWWLKQQETEQVAKEKIKAELQLLKARIHPHFLFNSLNNIYSFALEASPKTPEMIQKLSGLLHYMLHECNQPRVQLVKELRMIQDYVALEKIRYGERLKMNVDIRCSAENKLIAPLLLIPFVENSFKHGTSKMLSHPEVNLTITTDECILYFKLLNSRPNEIEEISASGNHGLGLKNVKKRLQLLYPNLHELQIGEEPATYSVWMKIALNESVPRTHTATIKGAPVYELA